ncbi:LysR family transcriptional regulator [Serratia microhaemolytica]|uniref:LysR family transcriptional regulator n=1 Tax=Serratia microhaemolytica TaxID=2675110 RepID=UPI000FDDF1CB|nr:LysR family transcriptional regulator [Serratia microhaemolytica]
MDQITSMETFVTVVQSGSYASAADILGISSTMVAKHINRLESNLEIKLLNRTTRKQSLTEPGTMYYHHCIEILEKMQAKVSEIREFNSKPSGTLKITAPITFGSEYLANHIHEFMHMYPDVRINLVLSDFVVDLIGGQYDLAFRIGDVADSGMIARPLKPYRLVVCAAPRYLARYGEPETPLDLENHNCLLFNGHSILHNWAFSTQNSNIRVELNGNVRINNGFALKNAALNGAGIMIQPEILLENELQNGTLIEILKNYPLPIRPINLIYLRDQKMPLRLREFIKFCMKKWGI